MTERPSRRTNTRRERKRLTIEQVLERKIPNANKSPTAGTGAHSERTAENATLYSV
jgi:hypothetical protein